MKLKKGKMSHRTILKISGLFPANVSIFFCLSIQMSIYTLAKWIFIITVDFSSFKGRMRWQKLDFNEHFNRSKL